ncbi:MAG: YdcF family protein [Clostridiales bacterium]|nr:YdcF family protein [Clostridiales bacterium]
MNNDYVLILGGPIKDNKPSEILFERIKTGVDYLKKHPSAKAVVSGGMTAKSCSITEAEIMKNSLLEMGIEEDRIIPEEKAMTTLENFKNTKELLGEEANVCFVTSEFHIWRSKKIMKKAGVDYSPVPAPNGRHSLKFRIREAFLRPLAAIGIIW